MALVYKHRYPTIHDTQETFFYFAFWFLILLMVDWFLSFGVGIIGFHPVWVGLIALFVAYGTVFLNKLGTP